MNKGRLLLIDVSNLFWRNWHIHQRHIKRYPGTYGFLLGLVKLIRDTKPAEVLFMFDSRASLRKELCPEYKANRKDTKDQPDKQRAYRELEHIQKRVLRELGFVNLWGQDGYEADDLLAQAALEFADQAKHVLIATTDHDLRQCITEKVSIWNANGIYTKRDFEQEHNGIHPSQYADVIALAGCSSDNVKGVRGIGIKTACKFIKAEADEYRNQTHAIGRILLEQHETRTRNLPLVKLPFDPPPTLPTIERSRMCARGWDYLAKHCRWDNLNTACGEITRALAVGRTHAK